MNNARLKAVGALLLIIIFFSQCTKIDTSTIGAGLIPGVDNINTFDTTFGIIANNFDAVNDCDSLGNTSLFASGIIDNHPLFGSARGEMYFAMQPQNFPVVLPTHDSLSIEVDSVVLVLKYSHSYGDTNVMQKVSVFELADNLKADSLYPTCNRIPHLLLPIGEASFSPTSLKDSVFAFREKDAKQLRITLPPGFGETFISRIKQMTSDSTFKELYKGFAVVPDEATGGESINYFNLFSESSRLSIYYRSKRDTISDTTILSLRVTNSSGYANFIEKDRKSSEITEHLAEKPEGDSLLFIDAFPRGSYARLQIPGLNGFPNSVINRAELIVEQVYDPSAVSFSPPGLLFLDIPDSSGAYIPIPCDFSADEIQAGFPYLGGRPVKTTNGTGQPVVKYVFNISRYVQTIVTKKEQNAVLRLRAPNYLRVAKPYVDRCGRYITPFTVVVNSVADGGVKLSGTNQQDSRIRLLVIYSKL